MKLSEALARIDVELSVFERGQDFFKWCDDNCYGEYEAIGDRMDEAFVGAMSDEDVRVATQRYSDEMVALIRKYKFDVGINDLDALVRSLKPDRPVLVTVLPPVVETNAAVDFFAKLEE